MKYSQSFITTLKSAPKSADTIGTENLIRGGFISQVGSGLFSYLPLGLIILKKIENIIDKELKKEGVVNILAPILQPASYWKESGRYDELKSDLWKTKNRAGEEYILAMTAEELFSDVVRRSISSYRDLPLILNQFQTKIRDELRPKGGLMRVREFIMQDAYSFDEDENGLEKSYNKIFEAYKRIFKKAGIDAISVMADVGAMGGKESREFVAESNTGEDKIIKCQKCTYAANAEIAEVLHKPIIMQNFVKKSKEKIKTPNMVTVSEVAEYLKTSPKDVLKSIVYKIVGKKKLLMVVIRGDLSVSETKLANYLKADFKVASAKDLDKIGLIAGYLSPIKKYSNIKILADSSVKTLINFAAGANEADTHYKNVNISDLKIDSWADLAKAGEVSECPECGSKIEFIKVIELGHTFKLGDRYSKSMGVVYRDKDDKEQFVQMGCYGIGLGRLMQAVAEINSDKDGISWPKSIAPAKFYLINISDNPIGKEKADEIYKKMTDSNIEVLYDDRDVSAGIKFIDADLIGCPIRITVSNRTLAKDSVEIKDRKTKEEKMVSFEELDQMVK